MYFFEAAVSYFGKSPLYLVEADRGMRAMTVELKLSNGSNLSYVYWLLVIYVDQREMNYLLSLEWN